MPLDMVAFGETAYQRGIRAIIAGAAWIRPLPVWLLLSRRFRFLVCLYYHVIYVVRIRLHSIVQLKGVPVAAFRDWRSWLLPMRSDAIATLAMTDEALRR
ncbi:hypothetical protein OURE66S_00937 [Oligella ureolytica]